MSSEIKKKIILSASIILNPNNKQATKQKHFDLIKVLLDEIDFKKKKSKKEKKIENVKSMTIQLHKNQPNEILNITSQ